MQSFGARRHTHSHATGEDESESSELVSRRICVGGCAMYSSHIPRNEVPQLFDILEGTEPVVSDSSALAVVSWNSSQDHRLWRGARDLDIYVPRKSVRPFSKLFKSIGYVEAGSYTPTQSRYRTMGIRSVTTLVMLPESIPLAPIKVDIIESTRQARTLLGIQRLQLRHREGVSERVPRRDPGRRPRSESRRHCLSQRVGQVPQAWLRRY